MAHTSVRLLGWDEHEPMEGSFSVYDMSSRCYSEGPSNYRVHDNVRRLVDMGSGFVENPVSY